MAKARSQTRSGKRPAAAPQATSAAPAKARPFYTSRSFYVCLALAAAIGAVYARTWHFDFVNFDDNRYIADNVHVRTGLSADNIAWAFTSGYGAVWIPLAWISEMIDCQLFGLQSGWPHLINVFLHTLSTLLLFGLLRRMTGSVWRSACVAFLFGLHPLRVESVAWVVERKDVLATFFWIATLWSYVRYVRRPGWRTYGPMALSFSLALLSKQTTVTLPFVLLLLDVWPLKRIDVSGGIAGVSRARLLPLIREKLPLCGLSAGAALMAYLTARDAGALEAIPFGARLANVFVSSATYLLQTIYPVNLAAFYPYPAHPELPKSLAALAVIAILSIAVLRIPAKPYLLVGWFWYLGTLPPVIGLLQAGDQAHADRFTYIPLIGISILLVWGLADFAQGWSYGPAVLSGAAAAAGAACLILSWRQVGYWKNTETLFSHALEVTSGNYVAHGNYGNMLRRKGDLDGAISHFQQAVEIRPDYVDGLTNLGSALLAEGRVAEAAPHLERALRDNPNFPEAHAMYGTLLSLTNRPTEAAAEYRRALALNPDDATAESGLGAVLAQMGQTAEALPHLYRGVQLDPEEGDRHYQLGATLARLGRLNDAIAELSEAVRLQPGDVSANYNLGAALASAGRMNEAQAQFEATLRLKPGYANAELGLAKVLLAMERYTDARPHLEQALRLNPGLREAREYLLQFYERGTALP